MLQITLLLDTTIDVSYLFAICYPDPTRPTKLAASSA